MTLVQVTCLATNLTFGNYPNALATNFLNFFSRFIGTDEFDPRRDPIPQLQALSPSPFIDEASLTSAIAKKIERARGRDLKKFGSAEFTISLAAGRTKFRNQSNRCSVSAIALSIDPNVLGYLSLDAIDPDLPHSEENTQWVCLRLNIGKRLFSDSLYREWAHSAFRVVGPSDPTDPFPFNEKQRVGGEAE